MAKRSIKGARAIVTGASSGIGRAVAVELARAGAQLVLLARRAEKLEELADEVSAFGTSRPVLVAGDVTDGTIRQAAVARAEATYGGLDVLVNNAGIGAIGRFADAGPDRLRQIMEVNFFAAAEMIRVALPALRRSATEGKKPIVVNVGSILGHRGLPRVSEYCASKFALHGFSESLRAEFTRLGIDVLLVAPGTTETEFDAHRIEKQSEYPWPKQRGVTPQSVAQAIVAAIRRGRHEIIPNRRGRLLCAANRIAPRVLDRIIARYG